MPRPLRLWPARWESGEANTTGPRRAPGRRFGGVDRLRICNYTRLYIHNPKGGEAA